MPAADKHARTEKPTPKRRSEAREKGQVARSPDVSGWLAVLVGSFLLPWYLSGASGRVLGVLSQAADVARSPSTPGALAVLEAGLRALVLTVVPLGAIFAVLGVAANVAQTGRAMSLKAARPRLSRISPKSGLKRLFSPNTAVQLLKQLLKLAAISGVAYRTIVGLIHEMVGKEPVSLLPLVAATASSLLSFVRVIALVGFVVGLGDFAFQRHRLQQSLKMTKDEVKDERRSSDGDPAVKAMVKKRMYQISRSRVLRVVRQADVVVTNPTHFAVALQYDVKRSLAPRVVAKGADLLARRIREEAATWSVPVVEDPPLARYLYAICDVDQQIPPEIYLAVAKLLAFVYGLPPMVRSAIVHRPAASTVPEQPAGMAELNDTQRDRLAALLVGEGR